jgi:hypothetical protein
MTDGKPAPSGSPVPVALAPLDRWWPETPALDDQSRADELSDLRTIVVPVPGSGVLPLGQSLWRAGRRVFRGRIDDPL